MRQTVVNEARVNKTVIDDVRVKHAFADFRRIPVWNLD
jgi:hypothetical protein